MGRFVKIRVRRGIVPKVQTTQQTNEPAHQRRKTGPATQEPVALALPVALDMLRFDMADPRVASPSDILPLQRAVDNRAIGRLIQAEPVISPASVPVQRLVTSALHTLEWVEGGSWPR